MDKCNWEELRGCYGHLIGIFTAAKRFRNRFRKLVALIGFFHELLFLHDRHMNDEAIHLETKIEVIYIDILSSN